MKFPSKLNLLRGTRFAWLLPLTWMILRTAAIATPTTIEVFLHHRFGARSGGALLRAFILLIVVCALSMHAGNPVMIPLFPGFVFAYAMAAAGQWLTGRFLPNERVHSYSTGEPWPIWRQVPVEVTTVQRYLEPALACLAACFVSIFDSALAHWIFAASIALFIKEQILRSQLRTRRLDALDNRAESEHFAPRTRAENENFVEAREAPPRPQIRPRFRP